MTGAAATGMGAMGAAGIWSRPLATGVGGRASRLASRARGVASPDMTAGLVMRAVPLPGFGRECLLNSKMSVRLKDGFEGDGLGDSAGDMSALVRASKAGAGAGLVSPCDRAKLKAGLGMGLGRGGTVVVDFDDGASPRVLTLRGIGDLTAGEVFALRLRSVPLGGAS